MKSKGQVGGGGLTVIGFLAFVILLMVGTIIFSEFDQQAASLASTTAGTAAIANVSVNTYSGITVVSVGPIIFASVVILGVVMLLYGLRKQ